MALTKNSTTPAPTQKLSSENQSSSVEPKAHRSPRRILSEHQKREVARLYAETTTPVPEIKRQFGIAESSLYRLIQQRGVALRGRAPVANGSGLKSVPQPTASNGDVPTSRQSVPSRSNVSRRQTPSLSPSSKSGVAYRVSFAALQIVTAVDIHDALRQAEHLGATEITAIVRSE
jgi:transposase-like protein